MVVTERTDRAGLSKGKIQEKGMSKVDRKDRINSPKAKDKKPGMDKVDRIDRARNRGTAISKFLKNFC